MAVIFQWLLVCLVSRYAGAASPRTVELVIGAQNASANQTLASAKNASAHQVVTGSHTVDQPETGAKNASAHQVVTGSHTVDQPEAGAKNASAHQVVTGSQTADQPETGAKNASAHQVVTGSQTVDQPETGAENNNVTLPAGVDSGADPVDGPASQKGKANTTSQNPVDQLAKSALRIPAVKQAMTAPAVSRFVGQLMKEAEEAPKESDFESTTYSWGFASVSCAVLCVLCPLVVCGICIACTGCFQELIKGSKYSTYIAMDIMDVGPDRSIDIPCLSPFGLKGEMYFMLLLPLLPLIAAPWTTCADGAPSWMYAFPAALFLRSKLVEVIYMTQVSRPWTCSVWISLFLWGPLEYFDYFSDGAAPVQAWACDVEGYAVTDRLANAWAQSSAWWFAAVVQHFGLWGLMALAFAFGALVQQLSGQKGGDIYQADAAAMLSLSDLLAVGDSRFDKFLVISVTKVFCENILQLILQTSFFALVFDYLSVWGKLKVLFSISTGLFSATQKTLDPKACLCILSPFSFFCNPVFLSHLLALACIAWSICKLYFAFQCDSHLWNFTTGCV